MLQKFVLLALVAFQIVLAQQVDLPYDVSVTPVSNYTKSHETPLEKPLLAYFAIPYAEPPVGKLRFQHPVAPKRGNGKILSNTEFGAACLQAGTAEQSEDCLTLSVFKPQKAEGNKLPVVIWTPGGAFNSGSGGGALVPSMVGNSQQDFIGVAINYRLGALGFLPSALTQRAGLLNLGLEDQLMAYQWVRNYIALFGGDPESVTVSEANRLSGDSADDNFKIWGSSAGAHSCGAHLQHVSGDDYHPPFNRVIMNSGGPTARVWPDWNYPLYQKQMVEFLQKTGCMWGENERRTFECLREVEVETIRNARYVLLTLS